MASNGTTASPTIEKNAFWSRLKRLYDSRKTSKTWGGDSPVDAVVVIRGEANDDDPPYTKTTALQFWLFGYELLDTIIVVGEKATLVVTSEKKAKLLAVLGDKGPTGIGLTIRVKDKSDYKADFAAMTKFIGAGKGTRIGTIPKDPVFGTFATGFNSALTSAGAEMVDVSLGFSTVMAIKDDTEIKYTTEAAAFTTLVLKKFLLPQVETVIDEEKKVKHSELAARVDTVFEDPSKVKSKVAKDLVDICYPAIVMSGKYDLRPSAESNDENLQSDGTVILQLGGKYANYPANVARTYFVNPSKEQQHAYSVLVEVHTACKASMKAGRKMSAVWDAAQDAIKRRDPSLLPHFTKNCGFGLGLDFRDVHMVLNANNTRTFAANMVFNLAVGFSDLKCKDKKGQERSYAVLLSDTLHITQDSEPEILTHLPRSYKDIVYTIDEGGDDKADAAVKKEPAADGVKEEKKSDDEEDDDESEDDAPLISGPRTRYQREAVSAAENAMTEVQQRIRENQKLLADRIMAEGYRRYAEDSADRDDDKEEKKETAEVSCYKGPSEFPTAARTNQIFVDQNNECILVPLFEQHVPFHISTIKNLHKTEGETTFLRINFFTPDMAFNANQKLPAGANTSHMFIQELTFRSKGRNLDQVYFSINELRKRYSARMKEHEQKSSLVEQEDLVLARPDKVYRLRDIAVRPQLARGKATGMVEVHQNGLRFVGGKSQVRLDVIFKNIKHAFFQAATKTTINVLCHFELHNPIMVGKKKSTFVQFFYDVIEASQDLETRARHADEDGLLEEQEERKMRDKWNNKFLDFVREVENSARAVKLEFDKPYPELSFFGVASKELVPMMPTVHCLVALDDNPPLCVTLADVEIAVFERLTFGLKSFDLTFVFKDLDKPVQKIDSIPVKHVDTVKEWLNQCNILFYELKINPAWKMILKEVKKDLAGFYQDGGWEMLRGELGGDEDGGGGGGGDGDDEDAESESGSEFAPSGEDDEDEESSEYDTSSEEVSEGDESEAGSDSEEENSEEDDWEELEKQAEKEDREKVRKERERDVVEKARPPAKRQKNK